MANSHTTDMETETESMSEKFLSAASQAQDKASELAEAARDKAQEVGRKTADKIDEQRQNAAGALESAAVRMHQTAESGADRFSNAVHSAAQGVSTTASYLRDHDSRQMMADVESVIKRHPGRSLLVALGVGFLVGRAFRND